MPWLGLMHPSSALWQDVKKNMSRDKTFSFVIFSFLPWWQTATLLCLLVPCWLLSHYYSNHINSIDLISSLAKWQCRHWDRDCIWKTNQISSWSHRDCMCEQSLRDLGSWEEAKSKALKLRSNANVMTCLYCVWIVCMKQGKILQV